MYMQLFKPTATALPVELLANIFILWGSVDKDGPWTASGVCKYWRNVVLGCPRAWCNVTYELRMISPPKSTWHLQDRKYAGEELCSNASDSGESDEDGEDAAEEGNYQEEHTPLRRYEEEAEEIKYVVYGTEDPEQDEEEITELLLINRRPFRLWLQRTGGMDFSLDIYVEERYPALIVRLVEEFRELQAYLPRLRGLTISTEDKPLAQDILDLFLHLDNDEDKPMCLRSFRLIVRGERVPVDGKPRDFSVDPSPLSSFWGYFHISDSLTFDGSGPNLHSQTFSNNKFDPSTLRHMTLRHIYLNGQPFSATLKHFKDLQMLSLRSIDSKEWRVRAVPMPSSPKDVVLHNLTHLTLHCVEPSLCIGLLPTIDAPSLTFFSLRNSNFEDLEHALRRGIAPYAAMTDLGVALARFAEGAPNVTTFHLAKSPVHDRHLLQILASWRDLRELALAELLIGPLAVRGLAAAPIGATRTPPAPSLCPSLQVLRVEKCDLIRGDGLVSLVRSRNGARSSTVPLNSLDVLHCENITATHIAQIRRFDPIHLSLVAVHD